MEEKIFEYVGDGGKWNLSMTFAHQNELRGNGYALLSVPRDWIQDEPVMVVATDYILEENSLLDLFDAHKQHKSDITMSLKECPVEELSARSSVDVYSDWRVRRIIEKPEREEIMSAYAASVMFIFPPAIWEYVSKVQPSERAEIELQSAVDTMIQDGFGAYGLLQTAPLEWAPEFTKNPRVGQPECESIQGYPTGKINWNLEIYELFSRNRCRGGDGPAHGHAPPARTGRGARASLPHLGRLPGRVAGPGAARARARGGRPADGLAAPPNG